MDPLKEITEQHIGMKLRIGVDKKITGIPLSERPEERSLRLLGYCIFPDLYEISSRLDFANENPLRCDQRAVTGLYVY